MRHDRRQSAIPDTGVPFSQVAFAVARLAALVPVVSAPAVAQADWTQLHPATNPAARNGHLVTDSRRGGVLLFGGKDDSGAALAQTWTWDGSTWTRVPATTTPSARNGHKMVEVTRHGRIVLFGGDDGQGWPNWTLFGDTWAWDGTTWSHVTTTGSPGPRTNYAMAYDAARDRIVLHGGIQSIRQADTWTFDWTTRTWTQVASGHPLNRSNHSLAYDEAHEQVVMFGGDCGGCGNPPGPLDETWLWNGRAWTRARPTHSPPARQWASMAWDPVRERIVLYGGSDGTTWLSDTWEWDGTDWTRRTPASVPPALVGARNGLVYDPSTAGLLAYAHDRATRAHETWRYATDDVATVVAYGSGCPTSAGMPLLAVSGPPWIGDSLRYDVAPVPAASLPSVLIGFSNSTWNGRALPFSLAILGYPSCSLLQSADIVVAGRQLALTIPNDRALVGQSYYTQGLILVPGGAPALGVTIGLDETIGIR